MPGPSESADDHKAPLSENSGVAGAALAADTDPNVEHSLRPLWRRIALLTIAYVLAAWLGSLLTIAPNHSAAIWPAAGIALMALYLFGYRLWPGVLLGSVCVDLWFAQHSVHHLHGTGSVVASLSIGAGITVQALLGAWLLRRFVGRFPALVKRGEIVRFLLISAPISCAVGALWATSVLISSDLVSRTDIAFTAFTWWIGDVFGALIVAPFVLLWLRRREPLSRARLWSVVMPVSAMVIVILALFVASSHQAQEHIEKEFEQRSAVAVRAFENNLRHYEAVIRSVHDLFANSAEIDGMVFKQFVAHGLSGTPGIQALSWNEVVRAKERARFEAKVRREVGSSFAITERDSGGELVAAADRDMHVVVRFIEPIAENERAFGYDVYTNPLRRAAMNQARDSAGYVITGRIKLVQGPEESWGILAFMPVYSSVVPPTSLDRRRSELRGFAVGVFRLEQMLPSVLGMELADLSARLLDLSAPTGTQFLAQLSAPETTVAHRHAGFDAHHPLPLVSHELSVGGRRWQIEVAPSAQFFVEEKNLTSWFLLGAGLLLIGLLQAVLLELSGRAELDARRVREMEVVNRTLNEEISQRAAVERTLFREKERAEVTLRSIGDAVITTDIHGVVDYLNPVAEAMTEWTLDEAQGMPLESVFRIISEETRHAAANPVRRCLQDGQIVGLANHTALISRSGKEYSIQDSAAPIREVDGNIVGVILVFNDVSQSRRLAREAEHHATHDELTGLVNRREFNRRLKQAVVSSTSFGTHHVLCYLDLDQFKVVNDTAGHHAGDALLKELAAHLLREVRDRDSLARLGGDEFGLLLDNCPVTVAEEIAQSLVASVRDFPFTWDERSFEVGVSVGLVAIDANVGSSEELLAQADVACYEAKDLGGNRVHVYAGDADGSEPRHAEIIRAADMRAAVDEDRFRVYSQPIHDLSVEPPSPCGREILLRMVDRDGKVVNAAGFIPAAERYGLMAAIDRWVIRQVFSNWRAVSELGSGNLVAINLSGNSLGDDELLAYVQAQLAEHDVEPGRVCFEITETSAIRNFAAAKSFITALRQLGCKFALDDFGTGLSSFGYLKSLPVDIIKIDGRFVRDAHNDGGDRAMVSAIVQVARAMGIRTIAEHVESSECIEVLRTLGVDEAQGYALSRPTALGEQT